MGEHLNYQNQDLVPATIEGVDVYIATQRMPGSEPTSSALARVAGEKAAEAVDRVHETIHAMAAKFAPAVGELARQAMKPESLSVQFGITIGAQGNLIVMGGTAQASVTVTLTYPIAP